MKFSVIIHTISKETFESDISDEMELWKIEEIKNSMKQFKNFEYIEILINNNPCYFHPDNIVMLSIKIHTKY